MIKEKENTLEKMLQKAEKKVSGWLKPLPRLPKSWSKNIAENVWWIQIIFAVLLAIGIVTSINTMITRLTLANKINAYLEHFYQAPIKYGGLWISTATISMIFSGICLGIIITSIKPLKELKPKGWNLLTLMFGINLLSSFFSLIANFNIFTFIFGLLGVVLYTAVGVYLLFEIKPYFFVDKTIKKETNTEETKPIKEVKKVEPKINKKTTVKTKQTKTEVIKKK